MTELKFQRRGQRTAGLISQRKKNPRGKKIIGIGGGGLRNKKQKPATTTTVKDNPFSLFVALGVRRKLGRDRVGCITVMIYFPPLLHLHHTRRRKLPPHLHPPHSPLIQKAQVSAEYICILDYLIARVRVCALHIRTMTSSVSVDLAGRCVRIVPPLPPPSDVTRANKNVNQIRRVSGFYGAAKHPYYSIYISLKNIEVRTGD